MAALTLLTAIAGSANALPQRDVVGYWTHELRPGFNLVAFPVLPDTPTLQEVVADRLGAVEVTTWDRQLGSYRWARFDPRSGQWSGNLYLLARGVAYWVNLIGADQPRRLTVVGHPELYTRFRWRSLRNGWQFYASTYGKAQALTALPPNESRDLLVGWDAAHRRFALAEATPQMQWRGLDFERVEPDRAYIVLLNHQPPRRVGPPMEIEALYEQQLRAPLEQRRDAGDDDEFICPPQPLIVGNEGGLAVSNLDGQPHAGQLGVFAVRERMQVGAGGALEPQDERVSEYRVAPDFTRAGRFRVALGIGVGDGFLQAGDRVHLTVRDENGQETRSASFEIPADQRVINDVSFPEPLRAPSGQPAAPREFALGMPFPNPFNDRFSVEVRLAEAAPVTVALYDIAGRRAFELRTPLAPGAHRLTVPAGELATGVYLLQVTTGAHKGVAKVAHLK